MYNVPDENNKITSNNLLLSNVFCFEIFEYTNNISEGNSLKSCIDHNFQQNFRFTQEIFEK